MTWIRSVSLQIADLSQPPGLGDKRILRDAARLLGLHTSSALVKRAMQFGSRIAQVSNVDELGSHRKGKGTAKLSRP